MRRGLFILAFLCAMPLAAATHVWTGAASDRVSDPANWTHGSPAGDDARAAIVNDVDGLALRAIVFSGSGYTISGKAIHVRGRIADISRGPAANVVAADLVLDGDVTIASITTTGNGLTFSGVHRRRARGRCVRKALHK